MTNGSITNTATGHAHRYLVGQTLVNSNSDSVTVTAGSALTLKKSADATTYDANQLITYSYLVTNTGNVTITDLAVTDDKIALVTCTDTTLAAGAHTTCTGTYTTDQGDVDHGSVTNNASVTGTPAAGNLAPATDSLTIDAAVPPDAQEERRRHDLRRQPAHHLLLPGHQHRQRHDHRPGGDRRQDRPRTCTDTTLAAGAHTTCTGTYTTDQGDVDHGSVTNNASVTELRLPAISPGTDSLTIDAAVPLLTLKKSADATTYDANQLITYSYLVTNTGNVTITDLAVTTTRSPSSPARTRPSRLVRTRPAPDLHDRSGRCGPWLVTNNASVTELRLAGNLAPATDSLTIDAAGPALTLKKSADATTYDANQLITYSYLVTNTGNVTITDLR